MDCRPQGFAKALECPKVPPFKASGMACLVQDQTARGDIVPGAGNPLRGRLAVSAP